MKKIIDFLESFEEFVLMMVEYGYYWPEFN